jgi:hypothetical protein
MITIPSHDGNRKDMASAAQTHIPNPLSANSACAAEILNPGDNSAGSCVIAVPQEEIYPQQNRMLVAVATSKQNLHARSSG